MTNTQSSDTAISSANWDAMKETSPRIMFVLVTPDQPNRASIFQAFSEGNLNLSWAYERIAGLPASLFEPLADRPHILGLRICGMASWRVVPMRLPFLRLQKPTSQSPLWVVFSADYNVARGIADWQNRLSFKPLHVSTEKVKGAIAPEELTLDSMREHLLSQIDGNPDAGLGPLREIVDLWKVGEKTKSDVQRKGHFALTPNQMTLHANGVELGELVPDWMGETPEAYRAAIAESVVLVEQVRGEALINESIRLVPPRPDLWLISPSWVEGLKERISATGVVMPADRLAVDEVIKRVERQRDFRQLQSEKQVARYEASKIAQDLHAVRKAETRLFAYAIGLATAGTLAPVWRIQPAINLVRGRVSLLGDNVRAEAGTAPHKVARLFHEVQAALAEAIGPEGIEAAKNAQWGIKVVSDAPVEWLPIGDLPLGLHTDVSRLSSTPGDALLRQLGRHEPIRLSISDFSDILVVSAFTEGESLDLIHQALAELEPEYADRLKVNFVRVTSEQELVDAINAYKGPLMIFDGHGSHPHDDLGYLIVGKDQVKFWHLRGRVRLPPIVVLSACDTQAAARSSATVANGLLHLGARTVLGTLLPIGGREGALMIARLVNRLASYLPIACRDLERVVMWSEVVGGMLRMQFQFDLLMPLQVEGRLSADLFQTILAQSNLFAHSNGAAGLDCMESMLAEHSVMQPSEFRELVRRTVPVSETIRYTQMGNPETILIGSVADLPAEHQASFKGHAEQLAPNWSGDDWSPDIVIDFGDLISRAPLTPEGEIIGLTQKK